MTKSAPSDVQNAEILLYFFLENEHKEYNVRGSTMEENEKYMLNFSVEHEGN
jgi:hypothetical protein